ncbi:GntR family transcriptional repressor for pyruvate dehydrogenase complex [Polynucleobacter sphagniphilus]|uniref:FadR/GntR family transcriptional regulator n=1 Tax=Polynucleobacter sphagniphilus TaxID=1743169 RepID=UPI002474623B|nr:FadR/GntR family transcriptional regulator [Polynucleobacter sphagniphilus]MDH6421748.1 GntR family transcriptional repressor for pyruvate dehydrogenase complex [Polynucleobacter sphagniphilus]
MSQFLELVNVEIKKSHFSAGGLGSRIANTLLTQFHANNLSPGTRLPSESIIAKHFKVSRTIVREAIAILKKDGILQSVKGSGTFIGEKFKANPEMINEEVEQSVHALQNIIEVRQGIESEIAALAAIRRTPGQLSDIEDALRKIKQVTDAGHSGVEEDVRFHMLIAQATGNPYWLKFLDTFAYSLRAATSVTRANEDRRVDFAQQVQEEHEAIVTAIASGNADLARQAASKHMINAAKRLKHADRSFWKEEGSALARDIVDNIPKS